MSALVPIFVSLEGRLVVVSGPGVAARDAARRLKDAGARVRLVHPEAPEVEGCETLREAPAPKHLDGATLVIAVGEAADDAAAHAAARERGVLVVSSSGPAFLGACEQVGGLAVAATSSGRAPELEARIAREAAGAIAPHHDRFADILSGIRRKLEERIPDDAIRADIWQQILDSPVNVLLQSGAEEEAIEMAERMAWGTG